MKGHFVMSAKEIDRVSIIDQVAKKMIKQKKAAKMLGLSVRQIIRLKKRYRREGSAGLTHRGRGRISNNQISAEEISRLTKIVKEKYWDFGPTLALEKLKKHHGAELSRESLRRAMIEAELWKPKRRRLLIVHQLRERRVCEGELVQIDGSPHAWFEDRGPRCTLLAFIDDATGKIKWLEFSPTETTFAYFRASKGYLLKYGKPLAFYADKNSIFRVNRKKNRDGSTGRNSGLTQFGRALKQLEIELIFAHSAPAKGRVERLFKTLQDRLVKEFRLKGIDNIKQAKLSLPEFIKEFNHKFAVEPKSPKDSHLPLLNSEKKNLDKILAWQEKRILSKNLTCQFENQFYQIKTKRPTYALRHAPVLVIKNLKDQVTIEYKGKRLAYEVYQQRANIKPVDTKQLNSVVDQIKKKQARKTPWKPPADHPWRQYKQNYAYKTL
jgi:transposase